MNKLILTIISCFLLTACSSTPKLDKNSSEYKSSIKETVRENRQSLRNCFNTLIESKDLSTLNSMDGVKQLYRFQIDHTGKVINTQYNSTNPGTIKVHECINKAFKSMRFKPFKGSSLVKVDYPIIFRKPKNK